MSSNHHTHRGVVHGKTIELDEDTGLPEGQQVSVMVQPVEEGQRDLEAGEGIRRSAGGWAEDAKELDEYLNWNRQQRKLNRTPIEE